MRGCILFVCLLLFGGTVEARRLEDSRSKAWKDADDSYILGKFEMAAILYEQAYRETGNAAALYNIAQSKRQAGKYEEAVVLYRSYLRVAPEDAPGREAAVRKIEELTALLKQGEVAKESTPRETLKSSPQETPPAQIPVPAPKSVPVVHKKSRIIRWAFASGALLFSGIGAYALSKDGEGACTPDLPGGECPKLYDTKTLGWSLVALGATSAAFTVVTWRW